MLYLLNGLRSFNEIFWKDVTYNIKSHKKTGLHLSLKKNRASPFSEKLIFGKTKRGGSISLFRVKTLVFLWSDGSNSTEVSYQNKESVLTFLFYEDKNVSKTQCLS